MAALFAADYSAKEIEKFFIKDVIGKFEGMTAHMKAIIKRHN